MDRDTLARFQILVKQHLPGWTLFPNETQAEEPGCWFWTVSGPYPRLHDPSLPTLSLGRLTETGEGFACGQLGEYFWECRGRGDLIYWQRDDGVRFAAGDLNWGLATGVELLVQELSAPDPDGL